MRTARQTTLLQPRTLTLTLTWTLTLTVTADF